MDERLSLKNRIEIELKSYDGLMGIYIDDLQGNIISFNESELFETASTIKVFIMAALFWKIEKKEASLETLLVYEKKHEIDGSGVLSSLEIGTKLTVKNLTTLMIIVSDNIATNILIEYLGLEEINQCIQEMGCFDTVLHNPIDFALYSKLGTTTPKDYGLVFAKIAKGELFSIEASNQMIEILKQQHYNSMLTKKIPPYFLDSDNYDEEIIYFASKSGSMNACRNDGGIVSTPYGKYVIVLLNKDFSDMMYYSEHPATVFGSSVSRLVFDQYLALEGKLKI